MWRVAVDIPLRMSERIVLIEVPYRQIKRLIGKYIKKEETIILAVVPANVDIATTEALQMAMEVDPLGDRTLGEIASSYDNVVRIFFTITESLLG